jgi:hypothetical protein
MLKIMLVQCQAQRSCSIAMLISSRMTIAKRLLPIGTRNYQWLWIPVAIGEFNTCLEI